MLVAACHAGAIDLAEDLDEHDAGGSPVLPATVARGPFQCDGMCDAKPTKMRDLRIIVEVLISAFLFVVYVMVMIQIALDPDP